jgi:hypothetical protein
MRARTRSGSVLLMAAAAVGLGLGCSEAGPDLIPVEPEVTALKLGVDLAQVADVEAIKFEVTPVDCRTGAKIGDVIVGTRPLSELHIPGGVPSLENNPLDKGSAHLFADLFVTVAAGCYDVRTTPVTPGGYPSKVCAAAWKKGVRVAEGKTTEILLINQCMGRDPGNIDIIATLNREPEIKKVEFKQSKFVTCGEKQIICATASDPDKDPLEFVWRVGPGVAAPVVVSHDLDPATGEITQCIAVSAKDEGKYPVSLTVYDLIWSRRGLVHIEDFLAAEGYPSESRAENDFWFYVADCKCPKRADVVMFHDLSGSFGDDLPNVKGNAGDIFDSLIAAAPLARMGVASFVDKPFAPFGYTGDYVFQIEAGGQLTADKTTFINAVNGMMVRFGDDEPEAQIEGLMHVGTHAAALGYSPDARRFVVMMTDASFHKAGDCLGKGCSEVNDGDGSIETREDYPRLAQIAAALVAADITPIFAVTADQVATYTALSADLTGLGVRPGKVVTLADDSSNVRDALLDALECPNPKKNP